MAQINNSAEDYLEAIFRLLQSDNHAHSVDIAEALGVTKPSAFKALKGLSEQGYIEKAKYGSVTLTEAGRKRAEAVEKKHKAIRTFLVDILGVSAEVAEVDACKIEHCISDETTNKLFTYLKF